MGIRRIAGSMEEIADSQHGYITRAQALSLGVSDVDLVRLSSRGELKRVDHGVYRFRGAGDLWWEPVWGKWLRLDPEHSAFERTRKPTEVVAGATAAWIYQLGDLDPYPYEFVVANRHQTRSKDVRFRRETLDREEWELVEGLPVTRPEKIIFDLLHRHVDIGHIEDVTVDALRRGLLSQSELKTATHSHPDNKIFVQRVLERTKQ